MKSYTEEAISDISNQYQILSDKKHTQKTIKHILKWLKDASVFRLSNLDFHELTTKHDVQSFSHEDITNLPLGPMSVEIDSPSRTKHHEPEQQENFPHCPPVVQPHGRISGGRRPIDKALVAETPLLKRWSSVYSNLFYRQSWNMGCGLWLCCCIGNATSSGNARRSPQKKY